MTFVLDGDERPAGGVRSVGRALDILAMFSEDRPSITLQETLGATGLPKTTALRLLRTLEMRGLIWDAGGASYVPGPGLLHLAHLAADAWRMPAISQQLLEDTVARCGETVNVYVRRDIRRVCIARAQAPRALRYVVQVGDELDLWSGASAKILLAGVSSSLLQRVAEDSPYGSSYLDQLERSVSEVQSRGWAISHGEREEGLSAVAVPVWSPDGAMVAAVSCSGPTGRFPDSRLDLFVRELRACGDALGRRGFGPRGPTRPNAEGKPT